MAFSTSEGRRARRIKGARRGHETIRAAGRICAREANVARRANALARRIQRLQAAFDVTPPIYESVALDTITDAASGEY